MPLYRIIQGLFHLSVSSPKGNIYKTVAYQLQSVDILSCVCVLYNFIICLGLCIHHHSQDAEEFQHH